MGDSKIGYLLGLLTITGLSSLGCAEDSVAAPDRSGAYGTGDWAAMPGGGMVTDTTGDALTGSGGSMAVGEGTPPGGASDGPDEFAQFAQPAGPCDLTGRWAVHGVTFTTADNILAPGAQKTSAWSYVEIEQVGDELTITHDVPCGLLVSGDAKVVLLPGALATIQQRTATTGRMGTSVEDGSSCQLSLERLYTMMSAGPFDVLTGGIALPGRVEGNPALDSFTPLKASDAEDWDGDGKPGLRFVITDSPIGSGWRDAIQRSWSEIDGSFAHDASDFMVPIIWDFEDLVLDYSDIFFAAEAVVRREPHVARYLRVGPEIVGVDDAATCANVREVMPHTANPKDAY